MRMAKKSREKKKPLIDLLPDLLVSALANGNDFILCYETDPETGERTIHVMTGEFVTSRCMLSKLIGKATAQKDEGGTITSRAWAPESPADTARVSEPGKVPG